jgi:PIN domain
LTEDRVIRLAVDINVFVADILSTRPQGRASASTRIVEAVREGRCPAGPVQLITSLPLIENFANVLERRLGYSSASADEKAWLLEQYALEGPMPSHPHLTVGSRYIPFETERQLRQALEDQLRPENTAKLFNEIQDDRYVLETALAGRAEILVTADVGGFYKGSAVRFARNDVLLFPVADQTLVIGTPHFVSCWLFQGTVPDAAFIAGRPEEFVPHSAKR